MKLTRPQVVVVLCATLLLVVVASVIIVAGRPGIPSDSLRTLGERTGLRVGTAVNMDTLGAVEKYDTIAAQQFSTVTPENVMKWSEVEPRRGVEDFSAADRLVDFARQNGQLVRGHNLVWNQQLPPWLTRAAPSMSPVELKAVLKKHVVDEVSHFKGEIWQWDVVNEPLNDDGTLQHNIWFEALGEDYIADAFTWAHEADPHAKLFMNDFNLEFAGPKSDAALALAKKLRADGVQIDGVGFEAHLDVQFGVPDLLALQEFADSGFDVAVTELDVRSFLPIDADAQSSRDDLYAATLQACVRVPRCISFTVWGFEGTLSWIPGVFPSQGAGDLYDHYKPKPEFAIVQKVLRAAPKEPDRG